MKNTNENYGMAATLRATVSVAGLLPKLAAMVAGVGILALFVASRLQDRSRIRRKSSNAPDQIARRREGKKTQDTSGGKQGTIHRFC